MRVSDIKLRTANDSCELQASVSCAALSEPFHLWYRFPVEVSDSIDVDSSNTWVAALLLPAMWLGEPLEVPGVISPALSRSLAQLQAIYLKWIPTLAEVDVRTTPRPDTPPIGKAVGLLFSSGVDSWYSLLKNEAARGLDVPRITHLIIVHGADIDVKSSKQMGIFEEMMANTQVIATKLHNKEVIAVATNVGFLYYKLGISWHWAQGGGLASTALAMERMFNTVYVASSFTYSECITSPDLTSGGVHPLTDPLRSTESCHFIHDGCEATRLDKIRALAASPVAMETLRVCWSKTTSRFNCGKCSKCLRTMLGLYVVGALGKCRTLPPTIDTQLLSKINCVFRHEFVFIREILNDLGDSSYDRQIRTALSEGIDRAKAQFDYFDRARTSIDALVPGKDPCILVDDEAIRFELGATRRVIPFLERDGSWWGRPEDDETAIRELERLRESGAKFIAFWRESFWWLQYYSRFEHHLRATYRCILDSDSLIVFDLRAVVEPGLMIDSPVEASSRG